MSAVPLFVYRAKLPSWNFTVVDAYTISMGQLTEIKEMAPMNESNQTAIHAHALSKSYKNVQALKALNLEVKKNSIFGFLGPNGAGKTTTIKLLLGLARPTDGTATVFGHDISQESIEIRKRVGYLAQNPRYYNHMTARQTLRFVARFFYSGPKSAIESRVGETLELVGLIDKADRPIKGFSGGELQRLGIAQAQVNYPDLLILDEPAAFARPDGPPRCAQSDGATTRAYYYILLNSHSG